MCIKPHLDEEALRGMKKLKTLPGGDALNMLSEVANKQRPEQAEQVHNAQQGAIVSGLEQLRTPIPPLFDLVQIMRSPKRPTFHKRRQDIPDFEDLMFLFDGEERFEYLPKDLAVSILMQTQV